MFEFLKQEFKKKFNYIIKQINPQVTSRLNTFSAVVIAFVENILREIKPTYINIYNKDGVLISKKDKIGFVNFYHSSEFSKFMKEDFGFDLKKFNSLKFERNKSGAHIEDLNDQLDEDTIRKYYYILFCFLKAYYKYETQKEPNTSWDDDYFNNLLVQPEEKVIEIEKKIVDTTLIKQKEEKISKLNNEAQEKDQLISDLKEMNQEYKSQALLYQYQTQKLENHYENELKKSQTEKSKLKQELEQQKLLSNMAENELEKQKSLNLKKSQELEKQKTLILSKQKEISELQKQGKTCSFRLFFIKNKKKIIYSLLAISLIAILTLSIFTIIKNSSNKIFYSNTQSETHISIGKNYDKENLVIPSTKNGKPITKIVSNGGYGNDNVVSVEIPDSVEIIDSGAFEGFSNLKKVVISKNSKLHKINSHAFANCKNLESFYFPTNVNYISANAFKNCTSLNYVSFESLTNWSIYDNGVYEDITLSNETNMAQLLTSINCNNNWYKKFYITYSLNGGHVESNPNFFTVLDTYIINNPTKQGYTFSGWTGTNLNQPTQNITISQNSISNRQYTANWTPINYSITYETYGGTHSNPTCYTIESSTIELCNPTKNNNKFLGWYLDSSFTSERITTIPQNSFGNITLYAKWTTDIKISNASELIELSNTPSYWGGTISLSADIDLNGIEWNPIGNYNNIFTGIFDGKGHIISNFEITKINVVYNGFFGFTVGATIKDLGLENYYVSALTSENCYAGGFVGYASNNTRIENCYTTGNISANSFSNAFAGGIAGCSSGITIKNCYSAGIITANNLDSREDSLVYAGGIVGCSFDNTMIKNCFSTGSIKAIYSGEDYTVDNLTYKAHAIGTNCNIISCYYLKGQTLIMDYINTTNASGIVMYDILVAILEVWDTTIWNIQLPEAVYIAPTLPTLIK